MLFSRKVNMRTHQIHVSNGREAVHEIRRQLFLFPEVLEVFATGRPDVLVVVYTGRPRPGEWLKALRAVGYRTPSRRHATSALRVGRIRTTTRRINVKRSGALR